MIAGIAAVVVVALAGGYCYKKNSENEGGQKEDRKLFKHVFKGKVQKKAAKDQFVQAEDRI